MVKRGLPIAYKSGSKNITVKLPTKRKVKHLRKSSYVVHMEIQPLTALVRLFLENLA